MSFLSGEYSPMREAHKRLHTLQIANKATFNVVYSFVADTSALTDPRAPSHSLAPKNSGSSCLAILSFAINSRICPDSGIL